MYRASFWTLNRWQHCALGVGVPLLAAWAMAETAGARLVFGALFGALLLALSVIDARAMILPNPLNAALALLGVAAVWQLFPGQWMAHAIGGAAGFGILFIVEKSFKALRGKDGLGRGDAKLLGAIGVWIGWIGLPSALLIASACGTACALIAMAINRTRDPAIPFGPFLAFGGWLVWLYGPIGL